MPFYKKEKRKHYKYSLKCGEEEIYGTTDDPRRTLTSIWKLYTFCKKKACVDLGKKNKPEELCVYEDDNSQITYKFKEKEITKEQFKQILNEYQKYDNGNRKRLREQ